MRWCRIGLAAKHFEIGSVNLPCDLGPEILLLDAPSCRLSCICPQRICLDEESQQTGQVYDIAASEGEAGTVHEFEVFGNVADQNP